MINIQNVLRTFIWQMSVCDCVIEDCPTDSYVNALGILGVWVWYWFGNVSKCERFCSQKLKKNAFTD